MDGSTLASVCNHGPAKPVAPRLSATMHQESMRPLSLLIFLFLWLDVQGRIFLVGWRPRRRMVFRSVGNGGSTAAQIRQWQVDLGGLWLNSNCWATAASNVLDSGKGGGWEAEREHRGRGCGTEDELLARQSDACNNRNLVEDDRAARS